MIEPSLMIFAAIDEDPKVKDTCPTKLSVLRSVQVPEVIKA
jgi:hypothetical protein